MAYAQTMKDLLVVLPGIMGSTLTRNDKEIFGFSSSIIRNLLSLGRNVEQLELPSGIGHDDPKDGVVASRLLPTPNVFPRFWKVDGYGTLIDFLERRFTLTRPTRDQPGNFIEFPYDWRLSNALNGQRLADTVVPELERWRKHSKNADAKLILICHSMGGLVARWFLEVLGGREFARTLITIGTPYRGSVNALEVLVNGYSPFGRFGAKLDRLVRSLPSVYQLLPSYDCLDVGDGQYQNVAAVSLPNVDDASVKEGISLHHRLSEDVVPNGGYQTFAIKGIAQPTNQSARLSSGRIETLREFKGRDFSGDGTVPRPSSHPPEWETDASCVMLGQKHTALQTTDSVMQQIFGILTSGEKSRFMAGIARIGLDLPDVISLGQDLPLDVQAEDGDSTLPLHAECQSEDGGAKAKPILLKSLSNGKYHGSFTGLPAGAYRVTVRSATPKRQVEAVSDIALVLDMADMN
jgi:pimeloyl-ACP methyl ester carboxylesterase